MPSCCLADNELNSTENIWEYLRNNWLSHCVWDTYEAILDACCDAWNALMAKSEVISIRRTPNVHVACR
jgi:hypothetical protein